MGKEIQAKIGSTVLAIGTPVVFTREITYKSEKSGKTRHTIVARVGTTGKVKSIEGSHMSIDLDRKMGARRSVVDGVDVTWVSATGEPVVIDEPKREDEGSKWRGIPYQTLKALAMENNLSWRETGNDRINTMWVIDALKKANIEPPALPEKDQQEAVG